MICPHLSWYSNFLLPKPKLVFLPGAPGPPGLPETPWTPFSPVGPWGPKPGAPGGPLSPGIPGEPGSPGSPRSPFTSREPCRTHISYDHWRVNQSKRWTDWVKATYRSSFGSRRSRLSITTGSTVQTGQAGWSGEAGVTFISPHTADCDGIARVSLLSGESWSTLRTRGTLGRKGRRKCCC